MPVLGITSTTESGVTKEKKSKGDGVDDEGKGEGGFGGTILKNDPLLAGAIDYYWEIVEELAKAKDKWWIVEEGEGQTETENDNETEMETETERGKIAVLSEKKMECRR